MKEMVKHTFTFGQTKWTSSLENLILLHPNNICADQPALPLYLIITFVINCLESTLILSSTFKITRFYIVCVAQPASMSMRNFNCSYKLKYRQIKKFLALSLSGVVFIMLINVKMPTIVGILTFMSMINFMLS